MSSKKELEQKIICLQNLKDSFDDKISFLEDGLKSIDKSLFPNPYKHLKLKIHASKEARKRVVFYKDMLIVKLTQL